MDRFYLGDGLYAQVDGTGQVILFCERNQTTHWVALNPEVLASFGLWLKAQHPELAAIIAKSAGAETTETG